MVRINEFNIAKCIEKCWKHFHFQNQMDEDHNFHKKHDLAVQRMIK